MGDIVVPVFQSTGALLLWLALTVVMPIVVGLVTKVHTSSGVKALLMLGLSLLNGLLSEWAAAGDSYNLGKAAMQAVIAFVIAGASYARLWRPLGVTAAAQRIGSGTVPGDHRLP